MAVTVETELVLAGKFRVLFPHLDERQRRLLMAAEARALGYGGIRAVARAAGVAENTVARGVSDLDAGGQPLGRTRRPGGGRKRLVELDPELRAALLALVEPDERGDPMSPLRWTTKSTRRLAEELTRQGHRIGADTVADLLRAEGFSLQAPTKTIEGKRHPDRDAQFRYINDQVKNYQDAGDPVISVDTKKKELVGQFSNPGRQWRPKGEPVATRTHDFPSDSLGKVVPYGVYDLAADAGWVNVGTDHDTAAFAVESIRRWWNAIGRADYPTAGRLLITADAGGSNGYRTRAWKTELAAFAAQTGLRVTVCHFPPGTSKWNKVEHRLFSHITMNWRGRPLESHEVVVQSIAATTTRTGLRVHAELDTGQYPTGVEVSDADMAAVPIARHAFHGDWNYTLHPQPTIGDAAHQPDRPAPDPALLSDPLLTGLSTQDLQQLTTDLDELRQTHRDARHEQAARLAQQQGKRTHAPRSGRPPRFTLPDQVLATILHLRLQLPEPTLAAMFTTSRHTIRRAINEIQPLLKLHGTTIAPMPEPTTLTHLLQTITEQTEPAS
ncbi:ISAzo13 family transposase [Phytohabitans sp. ZYX-F-186]|uniref:ISAzo13 family transposase n=1 Tax=Phytohabitans maris TaxID=3071409 RepID=A0ABU0ZF81_9ACTN|nr:ISAzo13 family transposase [Phytohabitans sp. ZYX-F-186]MDQ7904612.1 ISAzo13 family transposase [Phytohabitans sp. ZYX-F-186]MDQ7907253.1 ISAzo13 family transposase [Phytohabitans sp. ZYX-F-186]MDQ7910934.1 ISAzo13 family transposase [Phytohabitans sp. ZYX-F-186]MDQ7911489.1 ISAzo13 family transposase [Phytohabitans sp. ZYX-F-186]